MGAWGAGPFENDDALDFVPEINALEVIEKELRLHDAGNEIEADHASRIIVAGECVAAMRGHPCVGFPEELGARIETFGAPNDDLFDNARDAVSLVISNSELSDLWAESDDRAAFNRATGDLIHRLNQPQGSDKVVETKEARPNLSPCWICGAPMGSEFTSISVTLDPQDGVSQGGSVHLACLNGALHPRYMIQDWQFDDEMLARFTQDIFGKDKNE